MSAQEIRTRVLEQFCSMLNVTELRDGSFALSSPFVFADGDGFPIILERAGNGWRFTDRGSSAGHLFFDDVEMSEYRLNFVRRLAEHDGLTLSEDFVLSSDDFDALPTPVDFADFIQAVARIGGVVALERQAGDRYTTKVRGEVQGWLPPRSFTPNWHPQQDNHRAYAADLHVNPTTTGTPVVVFFVASAARAGTSTISLMQYREWDLGVQPVVAYKPKSITSQVVYRLQNAADDDSNVIPVSSDSHGFRTLRRRLVESGVAVAAS